MKSFNYTKLVRGCENWFSPGCKSWMWDDSRAQITKYLSDPKPENDPLVDLGKLAAWAARQGCVEISLNKLSGWSELYKWYSYEIQILRIEVEHFRLLKGQGTHGASYGNEPYHYLCTAIAFRQWNHVEWLGEMMLAERSGEGSPLKWYGLFNDPYRNFAVELCTRLVGHPSFEDELGAYAGLFQHWDRSLVDMAEAIGQACDWHVSQIKLDGEFENNPYELFPSEILALYRVREKLVLETPTVSHPLLDTPFTQVPEDLSYEPDELVEEAFRVANERLPEVVAKQLRR